MVGITIVSGFPHFSQSFVIISLVFSPQHFIRGRLFFFSLNFPLSFQNDSIKSPNLLHQVDCEYETATLGMGCFWGADALFGATKGVLRTKVGYTGGTTENPTYKNL